MTTIHRLTFALCALVLAGPGTTLSAQESFGRSVANGQWEDGNWIDSSSNPGTPGSTDLVFIGDAGAVPGAAEPASVSLASSTTISQLFLGFAADGNLAILSGGDLTVTNATVYSGLLDIQTGGNLTADSLTISGSTAGAILSGTATIANLSASDGAVVSLDAPANIGGLSLLDSTLNLNSNLSATYLGLIGTTVINRGAGFAFSVDDLALEQLSYVYDGTDSISASLFAYAGTIDVDAAWTLDSFQMFNGSLATINAASSFSAVSALESSLVINADLTVDSMSINSGTIDLSAGTLSGDLYLNDVFGPASQLLQNGGALALNTLSITGSTSVEINAGDNLTNALLLSRGAAATLNRDLGLASVSVDDSTLNLNSVLTTASFSLSGASAVISRSSGGHFVATDYLGVADTSYTHDGTDSILNDVTISNATLTLVSGLNARDLTAVQSTVDVETGSSFRNLLALDSTVLNVEADLTADAVQLYSSVLNLNSGTLTGSLYLGDIFGPAAQVNRNGGTLQLAQLAMDGPTQLELLAADQVTQSVNLLDSAVLTTERGLMELDSLFLTDATFQFAQTSGSSVGLSVDLFDLAGDSLLALQFDGQAASGLDWAFRWAGDHQQDLLDFLTAGLITHTGGTGPVSVVYDPGNFGDFTYLAIVAVPEPASALILFGVALGGLAGFRQRRAD